MTIDVALHKPLPEADDAGYAISSEDIVGYCRSIGVAASDNRLFVVVEAFVQDGTVDWAESEFREVNIDELDDDIRARCRPVEGEGVWWRSGRAYYPPGDV